MRNDADWWATDGAICALGTTRAKAKSADAFRAINYDYALAIATQLRANGTGRFAVVTSMGADARSSFLYTRTKGELEEAVEGLGFSSLTIVRPAFLGGERDEHRPLEKMLGALSRIAAPILPASAHTSPASTVAALRSASAHRAFEVRLFCSASFLAHRRLHDVKQVESASFPRVATVEKSGDLLAPSHCHVGALGKRLPVLQ